MEKVLLLNGGHSEWGMLEELHKLGKYVITTGNLKDSFVHKYADEYIQADYSDKERILEIATDNDISGIVSCAHDFGIITAAFVAEKLGLPGYDSFDTTCLLHQKDRFKKFAMNNNLQVPISQDYNDYNKALSEKNSLKYPVIVKPVDLTSGTGVTKVYTSNEYEKALKKAFSMSRKKMVVVEQFIEGTYHSFSTFLVEKKVLGYFSDNEYSYVNPYGIDTSAGPADNVEDVEKILIAQSEKVARILNLVNGVYHMQYVLDKNKTPYVFDITRRCSGDLYSEPVEHATGIPWTKWIVMSELGYPSSEFKERGTQKGYCGRHCILAETEGRVKDVIIDPQLKKYVYKDLQWWKVGDEIKNHVSNRLGVLFYEFPTKEERDETVKKIKKLVHVEIEK